MTENLIYYVQAGRTIMKLSINADWSFFGGLMKANFNKKYEIEDHDKPNNDKSGDYFKDNIGKFCNSDSPN